MAGAPGGAEVGRISVRVVPDTSKFAADLKVDLKRIASEVRVDIPTSLDTSGLKEHAKIAAEEAQRAAGTVKIKTSLDSVTLAKTTRDLENFGAGISGTLSGLIKGTAIASLGLAAAGAVPGILSLGASIASLAGVFALLPAVAGGATVAIGSLVISFSGMFKALKNINDPKKLAESLKTLSPAAAQTILAIKGLLPQFTALRKVVQESFFTGFAKSLTSVVKAVLPQLAAGLSTISGALGGLARLSLNAFAGLAKTGLISQSMTLLGKAITALGPAVAPLIKAFAQLALVGTSFLPGFAKAISAASVAFGGFIDKATQTGELAGFIQGGVDAFKALASVAFQAGKIILGVVRAAQTASGGTLATFADLLKGVADVVNGPAFQRGLTTVFLGLQEGAKALAGALPAIGQALAAIAPGVADLARALGAGVGQALKSLSTVIVRVAPVFNQIAAALANANPRILALGVALVSLTAIAVNVGKPLAGLVAAIAGLSAPVLIAIGVVAALGAIFAALYLHSGLVAKAVAFIRPAILPVVAAFQQLAAQVQAFIVAVRPVFNQVLAIVQKNFPQIQAIVTQVFSTIASVVVLYLTITRRQIQAITIAITFVWRHFGSLLTSIASSAFSAVLQIVRGALNVIQGVVRLFTALLTGNWRAAWNALKQIVSGALQAVIGSVRLAGGTLVIVLKAAALKAAAAFLGLGEHIVHNIGDLGSRFVSIGRSIIEGITSGVRNAAGELASAVWNAASGALDSVKSKLHINSPSKLYAREVGSPISEGIAYGITGSAHMVSKAVVGAVGVPSGLHAPGGAGAGGGLLHVENLYTADPDEAARKLTAKFSDAFTMFNLAGAVS